MQKSPSTSSLLGENTDSLLKEMDSALKASSNYIESHSSSQSAMPGGGTRSNHQFIFIHVTLRGHKGGTKGGPGPPNIGAVENSAFFTNAQSRFAIVVHEGVLEPDGVLVSL